MPRLSQDQISQFQTKGYLVVPDALEPEILSDIRAEYATLMDGLYRDWHARGRVVTPPEALDFWGQLKESYKSGCDYFQPLDISLPGDEIMQDTPFHFGPAVFEMLTSSRLLDIVEDLIGSEITSNPIQHVRLKPPAPDLASDEVRAHITATDWHQDRAVAHADADATQMVTVWIAITDATVENGCLQVIPKASDQETLPHCPKTQTAIADGFIDETRAIPLPVKAGGAVLFHPLTPHASLINRTNGFRWSFDIRYNVTGQPTGRSHFPSFVARSRKDPARVLPDWQALHRLWDSARAELSQKAHIPIHRWTSDAPHCA